MRAGVNIKEGDLAYNISCSRCTAKLLFPASMDRKDAVTKAHTRHGWKSEGKKLYCDGCAELMELADESTKKKPKPKPKIEPTDDDDDDMVELGEI